MAASISASRAAGSAGRSFAWKNAALEVPPRIQHAGQRDQVGAGLEGLRQACAKCGRDALRAG
jgi:hypothetical protein